MFSPFYNLLGVGKSRTIDVMAKWAESILVKADDEPLKPRVLKLAFTGKAASLIGNICFAFISLIFSNLHIIVSFNRWYYTHLSI